MGWATAPQIDLCKCIVCVERWPFFQENRLAFEFEGVKKCFLSKNVKKVFFYLLVSDHVVTLLCLSVMDDFFAVPIDFFWGLSPSLYADEVLCAASRAALPPVRTRPQLMPDSRSSACNDLHWSMNILRGMYFMLWQYWCSLALGNVYLVAVRLQAVLS